MVDREDEEEPASVHINTVSGQKYDINNISGAKKAELVMTGEVGVDEFVAPPNMPGAKLKALREAHRKNIEDGVDKIAGDIENPYKEGDTVLYKKKELEVIEVNEKGMLKLPGKNPGKYILVHHTKVEAVDDTSRDD